MNCVTPSFRMLTRNTSLFGLTTQQTVTYYRRCGEDHSILKVVVRRAVIFDPYLTLD